MRTLEQLLQVGSRLSEYFFNNFNWSFPNLESHRVWAQALRLSNSGTASKSNYWLSRPFMFSCSVLWWKCFTCKKCRENLFFWKLSLRTIVRLILNFNYLLTSIISDILVCGARIGGQGWNMIKQLEPLRVPTGLKITCKFQTSFFIYNLTFKISIPEGR